MHKPRIFLCLISFLYCMTAFASHSGFYASAALGEGTGPSQVIVDSSAFNDNPGTSNGADHVTLDLKNSGNFAGGFAVGYNFNSFFGFEFSAINWGTQDLQSYAGIPAESTTFNGELLNNYSYGISGVAYLPIDPIKSDLFLKLGIAQINSTMSVTDDSSSIFLGTGSTHAYSNNPAFTFGAGLLYPLTNYFSVKIEFDRLAQTNNNTIKNLSFNLYTLGFQYFFKAT